MGKELNKKEMEKGETKLNRVMNGDIRTLNSVVNCIRQIERVLDLKKNEIENKKKYTIQDLATIELAVARIKDTAIVLKHQRDEMEERLKSDSLELYDGPRGILKGMNIQDY
jgi:predicted  nucleic acid-binding Zn-ribbon protein